MKRLKPGTLVLIEARDWCSHAEWQTPDQRQEQAPLGEIVGIVDHQDETTLHLGSAHFLNDPSDQRDHHMIPIGCIEAVYELVVRREPLWRKRR